MKTTTSIIKRITVTRKESHFDRACESAYDEALWKFKADEDGNFGGEFRDKFPRSETAMIVEFKNMKIIGGMMGQTYMYTFETHLERNEEEE